MQSEVKTHDDARRTLLGLSLWARHARKVWNNRYIISHLREVELYVEQALVQLEYARLAEENHSHQAECTCPDGWAGHEQG